MHPRPRRRTVTTMAVLALALVGCAQAEPTAPEQSAPPATTQAEAITVEDAWIKAVSEEEGMTGVFGSIVNSAGQEAELVAAASAVAARVELHEVVTGDDGNALMQEKEGGFTVPAEGRHPLEPGADHIMLMDLGGDLAPGDEVEVTLEFSDGSTTGFTAPVKDYEGANENYGGHDHGAEE
ncbi:copper chaperone PCu(A)C [Marinactinospora thermotolerans]|uniref:Copper(I)-binding protein n=1 Tax=Marinactinospora thermotolerans DSM 45154 TaxID=1122192 RepID=A0A1T4NFE4_9ACTN|nr:copper chaperone PCu(A)C [Marinactinospora thermotolerans]SJZ77944.1 hypothetical protein SAMN02745673_01420 [Marinactinospora thermotolerans DSM 45154]